MREGSPSRPVINPDDAALEVAAEELRTTTERDTINTALREGIDRYRQLRALHELQDLVCDGALDTDVLLDKRNYRC
ncbi:MULTISPECIES: type II toxin-antitoxin system VapB family antitoxin [Streptomyces]|uniref:type II toxin-antitoxin system VapB family antitoxin n=1 Tax=Streptomyces TaxID=1883 RepID=UPI000DC662F0|nr:MULTISPECIES: type II toxin-antitoxin system VapB family antitoxin [Streptomyces]ATY96318.1 antitoxin [Streptomyces cavourensis]MBH0243053.1 type II toxin-antitoxin system VapB family antitoxin [Streptomyces cavourensis]NUV79495.1 type II toxin-antitoxin system VapB family antitoxin [Streptomyces sp. CAI-155]